MRTNLDLDTFDPDEITDSDLIEWVPHLDPPREEACVTSLSGRADPSALVEAACWLDLIDAEMAADHALPQSRPEVIAGLKQLTLWRGELQHLIWRLKSLEGGSGDPPLARRNMDDPNTTLREMAACP